MIREEQDLPFDRWSIIHLLNIFYKSYNYKISKGLDSTLSVGHLQQSLSQATKGNKNTYKP